MADNTIQAGTSVAGAGAMAKDPDAAARRESIERIATLLAKLPLAQDGKPGGFFVLNGGNNRGAPMTALSELDRKGAWIRVIRDDGKSPRGWGYTMTKGDEIAAELGGNFSGLRNIKPTLEKLQTFELQLRGLVASSESSAASGWRAR